MSCTDQKPFTVTLEHIKAPWNGYRDGRAFRCYLCGHPFDVGDTARWVFAGKSHCRNFMTCETYDGPDALARWETANEEAARRFWWLFDPPLPVRRKPSSSPIPEPQEKDAPQAREGEEAKHG